MARRVRVHPIFYARLHRLLSGFEHAIEPEVEFVGRHLATVEQTLADYWDDLPEPPNQENVRWVDGTFDAIPALFSVEARLTEADVIELRNIRIVIDPDG